MCNEVVLGASLRGSEGSRGSDRPAGFCIFVYVVVIAQCSIHTGIVSCAPAHVTRAAIIQRIPTLTAGPPRPLPPRLLTQGNWGGYVP